MKAHILFLKDRAEAERIEGSVFKSIEEVKNHLDDGVLVGCQEINLFTEEWNDFDDRGDMDFYLNHYFISYIMIIK